MMVRRRRKSWKHAKGTLSLHQNCDTRHPACRNESKKQESKKINMKTMKSIMKKILSLKDGMVKGYKEVAKQFADGYKIYLTQNGGSYYSTWFAPPYGLR